LRGVFISYRRDDTEGQAGRLFQDLADRFGRGSVFMDVTHIELGQDFRQAIDKHVASCGVLLTLIGKDWLSTADESGRRRLDDPGDFVRLETVAALKRGIPVVPVLVQGARLPRVEELPEDVRELAYRNGFELSHARWESDVEVLARALGKHVDAALPAEPPPNAVVSSPPAARTSAHSTSPSTHDPATPSHPRSTGKVAASAAAVTAALVIVVALAVHFTDSGKPPVPPIPGAGGSVGRPPPPTSDGSVDPPRPPTPPTPKRMNLLGKWTGSADCSVIFTKDDGKNVSANCNNPAVSHSIAGKYTSNQTISFTIVRKNENGCETSTTGTFQIINDKTLVARQNGWNGCGVKTPDAKLVLSK